MDPEILYNDKPAPFPLNVILGGLAGLLTACACAMIPIMFLLGIIVAVIGMLIIPLAIGGAFYIADVLTHLACNMLHWPKPIGNFLTVPLGLAIIFGIWKTGIIRVTLPTNR